MLRSLEILGLRSEPTIEEVVNAARNLKRLTPRYVNAVSSCRSSAICYWLCKLPIPNQSLIDKLLDSKFLEVETTIPCDYPSRLLWFGSKLHKFVSPKRLCAPKYKYLVRKIYARILYLESGIQGLMLKNFLRR